MTGASDKSLGYKALKHKIPVLLDREDVESVLPELLKHPPQKLLGPLYISLLSHNKTVKWNAVTAVGQAVDELARQDLEQARIAMRRLIWTLNDESGGIGWGSPECMGEIMACNPDLAQEFHRILFSYLAPRDDSDSDNFLEYLPLRRGAFWGVARLAQKRPSIALEASPQIQKALKQENDSEILALICLYLRLTHQDISPWPGSNLGDQKLKVYWNQRLQTLPAQSLCQV